MERMEYIRRLWEQDLYFANQFCLTCWKQFHLHGRSLGQLQFDEKHVCLATFDDFGYDSEYEECGQLDCGC